MSVPPLVQAASTDALAIWFYNMGWVSLYATMMWLCYFEAFGFLIIDGDNGDYFFRCYNNFASKLEFWSLQ